MLRIVGELASGLPGDPFFVHRPIRDYFSLYWHCRFDVRREDSHYPGEIPFRVLALTLSQYELS